MEPTAILEINAAIVGLVSAILFTCNLRVSYLFYILHILFLAVFSCIGRNYGDLLQGAVMCAICVIGFVRRDTMETRVAGIGKLDIVTVASVAILFTICEYAVLSRSGVPLSPLDVFRPAMMVCALVLACMRKMGIWTAWLLNSVLYSIGYCIHPMEAHYLLVLYVLCILLLAGCMPYCGGVVIARVKGWRQAVSCRKAADSLWE